MRAFFLLILSLFFSIGAQAAIEVYEFDSTEQEQQFKELGSLLRCPKCQNNTIADSNAELAVDLRNKVYQMTKEGQSKHEIIDYMTARYGNFVTYNPPFTIATSILWLGPLSVIIIGFGFIFLRSRRDKSSNSNQEWGAVQEARLNALLDDQNTKQEAQEEDS